MQLWQDARRTPRYFPPSKWGKKRLENCNLNQKNVKYIIKICHKTRKSDTSSSTFFKQKPLILAGKTSFWKTGILMAFYGKSAKTSKLWFFFPKKPNFWQEKHFSNEKLSEKCAKLHKLKNVQFSYFFFNKKNSSGKKYFWEILPY